MPLIRKLQLDSRRGLRINGESVKLKGGCIHHDNGPLGAVSLPDAEMRRIRLLKEGGYNAIRTAHNPPTVRLAASRPSPSRMEISAQAWRGCAPALRTSVSISWSMPGPSLFPGRRGSGSII